MKTITLILFTLLLLNQVVLAQEYEYVPFPTENAIWSEVYYEPDSAILERFALNGEDTIINSLTYKKLYVFYDTVFNKSNATYFGGIREDSLKRVYFITKIDLHEFKPMNAWNDFKEIVLYDFSLNEGDTLNGGNVPPGVNLIISKIDTIIIGAEKRKVFQLVNYSWVSWIEGIGSNMGLLFTSGDIPNNGTWGDLICFKQNDKEVYFNNTYNECMPVIDGIETNKNKSFQMEVFPNPTSQKMKISFQKRVTGRVTIFNLSGSKVFEAPIIDENEIGVDLTKVEIGLYLILFTSDDKILYNKKIIIN